MFAFLLAALLSLRWPWLGAIAHLALAASAALYANTPSGRTLIVLPLVLLSLAYFVGRPQPVHLARRSLLLPLAVALAFGAWPAYRVATRPHLPIDAPLLRNHLVWAAPGPAWPKTGANWHAATAACAVQSMRLPTARELVESLTYRNQPAGGNWDPRSMLTTYQITPAKEPPLWDPYSPVIYWWTSTVLLDGRAIRIAHNGRAMPTRKDAAPSYYGFRCVTPVTAAPPPPAPR